MKHKRTLENFDYSQVDVLLYDTDWGFIKTICNPAKGSVYFQVLKTSPGQPDQTKEFPLDDFKSALEFYNE